jgi:hypothetical protein
MRARYVLLITLLATTARADSSVPGARPGSAPPASEAVTPWPAVAPCDAFATVRAQSDPAGELTWSGARGERRVFVDRLSAKETPRPLATGLARDRPTRLRDRAPVLARTSLTVACEDRSGEIEWTCEPAATCGVEARYFRAGPAPSGTRGRDCADRYHERAHLAAEPHARALIADALALIERACLPDRCGAEVMRVAAELLAAHGQPWTPLDEPGWFELRLRGRARRLKLECASVLGNNRCMIDLGPIAFQQEESASDCWFGENLLMPDGANYVREDGRGVTLAGAALRVDVNRSR